MDQSIKKILQHTPYNTYDDLFTAVSNGKATIRLSNSACRQIAETEKPILANFGLHFGVIPSALLTIGFSVYSSNYWLLLLLLLELVFPFAIYLLNGFKIKTWPIALVILAVDLFVVKMPLGVLVATLSWLICSWIITWWQNKIYVLSVKILQFKKDAFEWAYNSHNLFIEDCYGNRYDKFRQMEAEKVAYQRLLNIIKIGAGAEDVDKARIKFASFYLGKGKDIPKELYLNLTQLSEEEKCERLLAILEIGIGITGIDNVSDKLLAFYKAKGVPFPNDI